MQTVAVIDYGMGNLHSVAKALEHVGAGRVLITSDANVIREADRVVFPGVGAIRDCMAEIHRLGFDSLVREVSQDRPFLGICVGMQALLDSSEENGGVDCIGLFPGQVKFFGKDLHEDGDAVVFMNFRADRARELTRVFVEDDFNAFARARQPKLAGFVMLTQYAASIPAPSAFAPGSLENVLGDYLAKNGKTQLRIAETEKYAHVTFFFSGGREEPFPGEERILVPSPKVATYDLQPEMSAPEVTDHIVDAIENQRYDVIVVNYANGDMVGHSGVFDAAVKAVECLDACVGRIVQALDKVGGEALITADHGNVEQMSDDTTGQAHTAHTCEPVPFIYVGKRALKVREGGVLADVAPTMLKLLGLPQPEEMTGKSILVDA